MTKVKNPAQSRSLGIPMGTPIPIFVPTGYGPAKIIKECRPLGLDAFKKYWKDPKHNFKLIDPRFDAYGNFMYGAGGQAAGYPDWFLQGVADYLHGWSNNPINTTDIQSGYNAGATGGNIGTVDYPNTHHSTPKR